ncbi:MAG: phosphohydrolase [Rhizobiaceae bacterium MnEN-MB40S]|nr:MAG: phosphohydrolase [Rhizobiaceae bacterium MnEN-MB40S]
MKCLIVSDLHYNLKKYDFVLSAAEHVDLVVLAGDFLEISLYIDRKAQAVVVQNYFRRIREKAPLLICSGNHDLDQRNAAGEMCSRWVDRMRLYNVHTDGDSIVIDDTLFSMCLWWDGDAGKKLIEEQLRKGQAMRPDRWVWVHHAPPAGSLTSWNGKRSYGDQELHDWIETWQPDLVFCGHVHQAPFVAKGSWIDRIGKTIVFNGGHQLGALPSYILLDTETWQVYWRGQSGTRRANLSEPLPTAEDWTEDVPDWVFTMCRLEVRHLA